MIKPSKLYDFCFYNSNANFISAYLCKYHLICWLIHKCVWMSTGTSNKEYQKIKIKCKSHHTEWSALTVPSIIHITLSSRYYRRHHCINRNRYQLGWLKSILFLHSTVTCTDAEHSIRRRDVYIFYASRCAPRAYLSISNKNNTRNLL